MTRSLILVSHGRFCVELKGSTEMIMGPQDNNQAVAIVTVPLVFCVQSVLTRVDTQRHSRTFVEDIGQLEV